MFADPEPREIRTPETKVFDCDNGMELGVAIPRGMNGLHLESHTNDVLMSVTYKIFFVDPRNGQLRLDLNKQIVNRKKIGAHLAWATMSSDLRYLLAVEWEGGVRFATSKVLLEDYLTGELTEVFKETVQNVKFQRCALSPDATRIAVGTGYYVGIRGKHDDPRRGHVLLFEKKAAP